MSARGLWLTTGVVAALGGLSAALAQNAPAARARHFEMPPLESLQATRERPLFSPTRKPPSVVVQPEAPPPIVESASLPFELTGIAVGDDVRIAILHNKTTNEELRLRQGDKVDAWQLEEVADRYILLRADRRRVRMWLVSNAKPPGIEVRQADGSVMGSADAAPTGEIDQEIVPSATAHAAAPPPVPPPITRRPPLRPPGAIHGGLPPRPPPNRQLRRN